MKNRAYCFDTSVIVDDGYNNDTLTNIKILVDKKRYIRYIKYTINNKQYIFFLDILFYKNISIKNNHSITVMYTPYKFKFNTITDIPILIGAISNNIYENNARYSRKFYGKKLNKGALNEKD